MTSERLSVLLDENELCFLYQPFEAAKANPFNWTVSDLFSAALETFIVRDLPQGVVFLSYGRLTIDGLSQRQTIRVFIEKGWPELFRNLGAMFLWSAVKSGMHDSPQISFFEIPVKTVDTSIDNCQLTDSDVYGRAFWLYERFVAEECFILDIAMEAFFSGVRNPPIRPDMATLKNVAFCKAYRIEERPFTQPRSYEISKIQGSNSFRTQNSCKDPFRYPAWACGWHSGWNQYQNDPCSSLELGGRNAVNMVHCPVLSTEVYDATVEIPPFLLKSSEGKIPGLSSGAGGALVRWGSDVFKLKRCGLANRGIFLGALKDRRITALNNDLLESTVFVPAGLAPIATLEKEVEVSLELPNYGVRAASEPKAIYAVVREGYENSGCLVSRVISDLRVDEVLYTLLCNPSEKLSEAERNELIIELGAAEGSLYKTLHHQGFVRGIGNSWLGNEALAYDGQILLCDLENTFFPKSVPVELHDFYKRHEVNFYQMAIYRSVGQLNDPRVREIMTVFLDSFQQSYESSTTKPQMANQCARWIAKLQFNQINSIYKEPLPHSLLQG